MPVGELGRRERERAIEVSQRGIEVWRRTFARDGRDDGQDVDKPEVVGSEPRFLCGKCRLGMRTRRGEIAGRECADREVLLELPDAR